MDEINVLVDNGILNQGQGNSLIVKLENAEHLLDKENPGAASNILSAFINQVEAFIKSGVLPLPDGQTLIGAAEKIIQAIE